MKGVTLILIFGTTLTSCEDDGSPECRVYLEEESPNYFKEVYIVESPAGSNGNWGSNLINDYETLENYDYKMYKLSPGTYDVRLVYSYDKWNSGEDGVYEDFDQTADDGEGMKFNASSKGYFYITTFNFDH